MKYAHILMAAAAEIWAMQPEKLAAIVAFLSTQAAGEKLTADEIEAKIAPATARATARREGVVAIVPLRGVIANRAPMVDDLSSGGGMSNEGFARAFAQVRDDETVKAIILDVDSPGGAVSGTDESAQMVFEARGSKPIIAQVNATSASAAYWISSAASEIVVTPSGMVGSIGVYTIHDDISAALEKLGVKKTLIGAGKFKGEMAPFAPLGEEALAYMQGQINSYYGMFVDRVASGRGVAASVVRSGFGEGRMVTAKDAISQGMADRIGTLNDTLARFGASPTEPAQTRGAFATQRKLKALSLPI